MDRGSYVAASGGAVQFKRLEVVNNNLANTSTPGFKKEMIVSHAQGFNETLAAHMVHHDPFAKADNDRMPSAIVTQTVTDFSMGPINATGNSLDIAIKDPNAFLEVETSNGVAYTRAGNLSLNADGEIVTADGHRVLSDGSPISTNGAAGVKIVDGGAVLANGATVGTIQVKRFDDTSVLKHEGGNRFVIMNGGAAPSPVDSAPIVAGSLEMSNVSAVSGVMDLIATNRAFDMYTKTAQTIDQMNSDSISRVGRKG
jgi:flagellar basal-body rod protein FlgF